MTIQIVEDAEAFSVSLRHAMPTPLHLRIPRVSIHRPVDEACVNNCGIPLALEVRLPLLSTQRVPNAEKCRPTTRHKHVLKA